MEGLRHREPGSESVDLRWQPEKALNRLREMVQSGVRIVYLDALDEALPVHPFLDRQLLDVFRELRAVGVSWRLACRPASWTADLARLVPAQLTSFDQFELLPLDRDAVEVLAGGDYQHFSEAVRQAHIGRQLAQPQTARLLFDRWRATGELPTNRSESMRHTIRGLLEERGDLRALRQPYERLWGIAERLATIVLAGSVGRFILGNSERSYVASPGTPDTSGSDTTSLLVPEIPVGHDLDIPGAPVTLDDVKEVLGTALFVAAGDGGIAFTHQSYAEFLTASYLARKNVSGPRLLSLLGADTNGLVPGPMIEVLGWMTTFSTTLPPGLVADNAESLLGTAGLELAANQVRAEIVQSLLCGASTGSVAGSWTANTAVLAHPGLAGQLQQAAARPVHFWEIFWIARIARHCAVYEVADDLLAAARDTKWPDFIRADAVRSFSDIAPVDRMVELEAFLTLDETDDPNDELLAASLRAMLRLPISVDQIEAVLRPRRRTSFYGDYAMLLDELPTHFNAQEALQLLRSQIDAAEQRPDDDYRDLAEKLIARVWEVGDEQILSDLGAVLGSERADLWLDRSSLRALPWEAGDDDHKRLVVAESALFGHRDAWLAVLHTRLLGPADLSWLLSRMEQTPLGNAEPARAILDQFASQVDDARMANQILEIRAGHPVFDALARFRGSCSIDARPKDRWAERKQVIATRKAQQLSELRSAMSAAAEDPTTFWMAAKALAADDRGHRAITEWDLTKRPLWSTLTPDEQVEFQRLALRFVTLHKPEPDRWSSSTRYAPNTVLPDWTGAFVFATAALHTPEDLALLPPRIWEPWVAVLVKKPWFGNSGSWGQLLIKAAPDQARTLIGETIQSWVRSSSDSFYTSHPLVDLSDVSLHVVLAEIASDPEESSARRDTALSLLESHAPERALATASDINRTPDAPLRAQMILARLSPEAILPTRLSVETLPEARILRHLDAKQLDDTRLSDLAGALLDAMPFADDPPRDDEHFEITDHSEARRVRFAVLQGLAERGLAGALASLRVGRDSADVEQIDHFLREARGQEARQRWRPTPAPTIFQLLEENDARLVRNSADLSRVLLEQLEKIQHDLRQKSDYRILWNEPYNTAPSPKGEDDISDWLKRDLALRLSPHVVVDREVQVRRDGPKGVGTRIDVTVTSGHALLARVLFEAKLVKNRELPTAIDHQLVGQYLAPEGLTNGIYIVYWVTPSARPQSWGQEVPRPRGAPRDAPRAGG
ncbi:hypothetical protein [Promicromonospora aerolata]|uniref:ATP-binding protein n=1 Tax=Promicromonospora aerolata TaxID=195749 RepID=A0ABW4V7J4_9MICO